MDVYEINRKLRLRLRPSELTKLLGDGLDAEEILRLLVTSQCILIVTNSEVEPFIWQSHQPSPHTRQLALPIQPLQGLA